MNCRLCLKKCEEAIPIFTGNYENCWLELINKYLFLKVEPDDAYSTNMCLKCSNIIENFHKFYQWIQKCQLTLQTIRFSVENKIAYSPVLRTIKQEQQPVVVSSGELLSCSNVKMEETPKAFVDKSSSITVDATRTFDSCVLDLIPKIESDEEFLDNDENKSCNKIYEAKNAVVEHSTKDENTDRKLLAMSQLKTEFLSEEEDGVSYEISNVGDESTDCTDNSILSNIETIINNCDGPESKKENDNHLSNSENKETLDEDSILPKSVKNRTCSICSKILATIQGLKEHMRRQHNGENKPVKHRTCHVCHKVYPTIENMERHMRRYHRNVHIHDRTCPICYTVYANVFGLKLHLRHQHNKRKESVKRRTCLTCSKVYPSLENLERHLRRCHVDKNDNIEDRTCPLCSKIYPSIQHMKSHIRSYHNTKHENIQDRTCSICSTVYSSVDCLKQHMRRQHKSKHETTEHRTCSICFNVYPTIQNLKDHKRRCHDGKHESIQDRTCPICLKVASNITTLRSHITKSHDKAKPFACSVCNKAFVTRSGFQAHLRNCVGMIPNGLQANGPASKNSFPEAVIQACLILPTSQKNNRAQPEKLSTLDKTDIELRTCAVCDKIFDKITNLDSHMSKVHKGLKPFSCKDCNEKFSSLRGLKRHFKIKVKCKDSEKVIILPENQDEEAVNNGCLVPICEQTIGNQNKLTENIEDGKCLSGYEVKEEDEFIDE